MSLEKVVIRPHTARYARNLNQPTSVAEFAAGRQVHFRQVPGSSDYVVTEITRRQNPDFICGPLVGPEPKTPVII